MPEAGATVWVLYEEAGAYSSYFMGILGVFSDPEKAKLYVEEWCEQAALRHPSNYVLTNRSPWEQNEDGEWESHIRDVGWDDEHSWSIEPYEINSPASKEDG